MTNAKVSICARMLLNKTSIKSSTPKDIEGKLDIASRFWSSALSIKDISGPLAKQNTVAAQPVMLKAIAKLVYDFAFSRRAPNNGNDLLDKLLDGLTDIDFSHNNPLWRYYELSEDERKSYGLDNVKNYLPNNGEARDLGVFQNGYVRFANKHNDVYPLLADMIRYSLSLPSRHTLSTTAK